MSMPQKTLPRIFKEGHFWEKQRHSSWPVLFLYGSWCPSYNRLATLQCFIKMCLSASLTSVRQSLFIFLSSCLWRAPCETWSALLYFHGVHVLLGFFIHCSILSEEKIFRDAWWVSIGKMERSDGIIYSVQCFAASDQQPKRLCFLHQRGIALHHRGICVRRTNPLRSNSQAQKLRIFCKS